MPTLPKRLPLCFVGGYVETQKTNKQIEKVGFFNQSNVNYALLKVNWATY